MPVRVFSSARAGEEQDATNRLGVRVLASFPLNYGRLCVSAGSVVNFSGDAIVNAANTGCQGGGGVDGAICDAGGVALAAARRALPKLDGSHDRCRTGHAVITIGGNLAAPWCIHAVGPVYGNDGSHKECDALVTSAYAAALSRAKEKKLRSVGFSLLSSGIFRGSQSLDKVLEVGVLGVQAACYKGLDEVHLVAFTEKEQAKLVSICKKMLGGKPAAKAPAAEAASAPMSFAEKAPSGVPKFRTANVPSAAATDPCAGKNAPRKLEFADAATAPTSVAETAAKAPGA